MADYTPQWQRPVPPIAKPTEQEKLARNINFVSKMVLLSVGNGVFWFWAIMIALTIYTQTMH